MLPSLCRTVGLAVREKWINNSDLFAFADHDIDRVVQERITDRRRWLRHKDARLRLLTHEHRKRADVVEMRVRKQDSADLPARQSAEQMQSHFAFLLGMHSAIEHHAPAAGRQIVTIRADLRPARQIDKLQNESCT